MRRLLPDRFTLALLGTVVLASLWPCRGDGAKWFGGTRWGAGGAFVGGIVGLFFMPVGLIAGPLIGAFLFEKAFARQEMKPAVSSGIGSAVGTLAGMGMKIVIGLAMVAWFLIDSIWIG